MAPAASNPDAPESPDTPASPQNNNDRSSIPVDPITSAPPKPAIYARAYVIATELHYESSGKAADYSALSVNLPDLEKFIRETFHVKELPGNFRDQKGFSYRKILASKNTSAKGQLKVPFRQIIDHPEVFGERISLLAKDIYNKIF